MTFESTIETSIGRRVFRFVKEHQHFPAHIRFRVTVGAERSLLVFYIDLDDNAEWRIVNRELPTWILQVEEPLKASIESQIKLNP